MPGPETWPGLTLPALAQLVWTIPVTPVHSHLRNRTRRWFAAFFLLVGTLSAVSTASGYSCPRAAPDHAIAGEAVYADSDTIPSPEPVPNPVACGAPALAAVTGATLAVPPLRAADVHAHTSTPPPEPDPTPRDRPPLQS